MADDLLIEKAARATWLIEHREPGGGLKPVSAWRDLAPALKERERDRVREAQRLLRSALSVLDRPAPTPPTNTKTSGGVR